ncbi:MAG: M23 family metallopeptidase [Clostridia bacterium]|nr:M23 family metallopeptidase [Clostridia bacterium]
MREKASLRSGVKMSFLIGKKLKVLDYEGDFIKVQDPKSKEKGYVFKLLIIDSGEAELTVTTYNNVYKGDTEEDSVTIKYNGSKSITWSLDKNDVVQVTQGTEKNKLTVKGLDFGTATLTVSAGLLSKKCKLYCYYDWKQDWETTAKKASTIYKGPGSDCGEKAKLAKDEKFIVKGDDGGSAGWAYGYTTKNKTNYWGYVRIENISTKGTVSQYNSMEWRWPIKDTSYNYISSPYGNRTVDPIKHKGFDIATDWDNNQPSIKGQTIVSSFKGTVDYVCKNSELSWGYCVSVISDDKIIDPVTKKPFVAIYMHMKSEPNVSRGQKISQGKELGYVGTTGNSTGNHLHFEVNNQTASIYESNGAEASDSGRKSYNDLINPIFFFLVYNPNTRNVTNAYWYGSE